MIQLTDLWSKFLGLFKSKHKCQCEDSNPEFDREWDRQCKCNNQRFPLENSGFPFEAGSKEQAIFMQELKDSCVDEDKLDKEWEGIETDFSSLKDEIKETKIKIAKANRQKKINKKISKKKKRNKK